MRIILTGGTGQLGWELRRTLAPLAAIHAPRREELDLRNSDGIREVIRKIEPDVIVNAAAYNDVDRAETEPELTHQVNSEAPGVLAEEASRLAAVLIQYSTDYVFRGAKKRAYTEDDTPDPVNVYGRSKLKGERAVAESEVPHFVFRLSWMYGPRRSNFVKNMLRLYLERDELQVVDDRWGTPTWCRTPAEVTAQILAATSSGECDLLGGVLEHGGLYHLAAKGRVSRYEQATFLQRHAQRLRPEAGFDKCELLPIPASEYPEEAPRPRSTPLSSDRLEKTLGFSLPSWEEDLVRCLEDYLGCG